MKQIKQVAMKFVMFLICCVIILPASAANMSNPSKVQPLQLNAVEHYIAVSTSVESIKINNKDVTYYFGDGFTVVEEHTGYYLIQYNGSFSWITVNGTPIETAAIPVVSPAVTVPTAWSTIIDTGYVSFDVGGLPLSVVGGLIGGAIGGLVTGGAGAIISAVSGALIGMFLNGVFPNDYWLTVRFCSKVRIIQIDPTIGEYIDTCEVYGGPSSNKKQKSLYYNSDRYERPIDGY